MTYRPVGLAILCSAVVTISSLSVAETRQVSERSLKAKAVANGGRVSASMDINRPLATLADVAAGATLIVRGIVAKAEPRLSQNEEFVFTYVTITPTQVFKNNVGLGSAPRPGLASPIIFVQLGGTVRTDGLEIIYQSSSMADPPLQAGDEIIAFLEKSDEAGFFRLHYSEFGLLRVHNGRVAAATKQAASRRPLESDKVEQVQDKIQQVVSASRKDDRKH